MSESVPKVIINLDNLNAMLSCLGKSSFNDVVVIFNNIQQNVVPYSEADIMSNILTELRDRLTSYESEAKDEILKFLEHMHIVLNADIAPVAGPVVVPDAVAVPESTYSEPVPAPAVEVAPVIEATPISEITDVVFTAVADAVVPDPAQVAKISEAIDSKPTPAQSA